MGFVVETRHCIVGLWLQERGFDPAFLHGGQAGHPPAIQKIGDKRSDEHGLARSRQSGHADADDRLEQGFGDAVADGFHPAPDSVGQ